MPNFLTFDIEEWYRVNYDGIDTSAYSCDPAWMNRLVDRLLSICEDGGCRCTFFILGSVAEACPAMVKRIAAAGHEIASHSYAHQSVFSMSEDAFREDLSRSCGILESLCGTPVNGFRAPSFSVTRETLPWFYETLERCGLRYSSSVFPGKTFLYGIPDFPREIHRPMVNGHRVGITEFPMTRVDLAGRTVGLYVRMFPASVLRWLIHSENSHGRHAMIYIHPREIDPNQPRLPLHWPQSLIHYFGIRGCDAKLRNLLRTVPGPFLTLAEALDAPLT